MILVRLQQIYFLFHLPRSTQFILIIFHKQIHLVFVTVNFLIICSEDGEKKISKNQHLALKGSRAKKRKKNLFPYFYSSAVL